jgi:hypothetical protein
MISPRVRTAAAADGLITLFWLIRWHVMYCSAPVCLLGLDCANPAAEDRPNRNQVLLANLFALA